MTAIFHLLPPAIWLASFSAAITIHIVLLVRRIFRRQLTGGWRALLWLIVAIRLICPWAPQSPTSIFTLFSRVTGPTHITQTPEMAADPISTDLKISSGLLPTNIATQSASPAYITPLPTAPAISPTHALLCILWWLGVVLMIARTFIANLLFRRRLATAPVSDQETLALLDRCRAKMKVRRTIALAESSAVTGPALYGLHTPTILLPPGLADALPPAELECIFLHELAHARKHDLLGEVFIALLTAFHWFNPLVWLAARCYRADREIARDAMVLRDLDDQQADPEPAHVIYGNTLLHLLSSTAPRRAPAVFALGLLPARGALQERFTMLARPRHQSIVASFLAAAALLFVGCTTLTNPRPVGSAATAPSTLPIEIAVEGDIVTRVYDIRDLLVQAPNYEAPDFNIGVKPKPPATQPAETRDQLVARLINLLKDTVFPDTWQEPAAASKPLPNSPDLSKMLAARPGAIRELSGQFIIRQTRPAHDDLLRLLKQIRETRALQITVEARFLLFDPTAFPKEVADLLKPAAPDAPVTTSPHTLTRQQVNILLSAFSEQQSAVTMSAPRVSLLNGQRAYVLVATQRAYTSNLKVDRSVPGKPKYEPETEVAESGVMLDVQATASQDRKYITLNLHPQVSKLLGIDTVPFPDTPPDHPAGTPKPTIQQPRLSIAEVRSTVSIPDGQTIVFGGFPDVGYLSNDANAKPNPNLRLYFLIKPTLIVQTEKDQRSFPLLNTKLQSTPRQP